MTDLQLLEEAKAALHKLMIGQSVKVLQKDGRRIEYTPAQKTELQLYIRSLESNGRRGPAGIY